MPVDPPPLNTEALLRCILDSSPDGIMVLRAVRDYDGRVVDFRWSLLNHRAAELLGRTADVLEGRSLFAEMPGPTTQILFDHLVRVVESGRPMDLEHYHEHARARAWFRSGAVRLDDGVAVTFSDVTDRKRLEEQLLQSQKMEIIGRLAGGVAHDFNNLLTAISMSAELALDQLEASALGRPEVEGVLDGVRRASALTQQLLAFARRQNVSPRVVSIDDLLKHSASMLQRLLGSGIELEVTPSGGNCVVAVDPVKFEQVLTNLAVNAHDAMPRGGRFSIDVGMVTVREGDAAAIRHVAPGDYARLEARDNGSGMPPEVLQHIFEPFFTTKGAARGTGLGLATSNGIVRQAGGTMWATSTVGFGSTFTILLPRSSEAPESWPPFAVPTRPTHGTERVLVVDDEPAVRAVVARTLEHLGYHISSAQHGEEALGLLREDPRFDLVLTDIIMPHMDGRELQRTGRRQFPRVPMLLMSGYEVELTKEEGPILKKPFTAAELARAVRDAIQRSVVERGAA